MGDGTRGLTGHIIKNKNGIYAHFSCFKQVFKCLNLIISILIKVCQQYSIQYTMFIVTLNCHFCASYFRENAVFMLYFQLSVAVSNCQYCSIVPSASQNAHTAHQYALLLNCFHISTPQTFQMRNSATNCTIQLQHLRYS